MGWNEQSLYSPSHFCYNKLYFGFGSSKERLMIIRVMYKDYKYDYVNARKLDQLIASQKIIKFVRPSEDTWIHIDRDPIRGTGGSGYDGPERRSSHLIP
mgnify:FL=1|jgi:hypothetical protein